MIKTEKRQTITLGFLSNCQLLCFILSFFSFALILALYPVKSVPVEPGLKGKPRKQKRHSVKCYT
jgi:hypothetical protein